MLSALDSLPTVPMTFLAFFVASIAVALLASLVVCIPMKLLVLDHVASLSNLHINVLVLVLLSGECLVNLAYLVRLK